MGRYARIFKLYFQDVIQNKGRAFIYFLMTLLNPLLLLLFWNGAISQDKSIASQWSFGEMTSYYLLITISMSFLIVHIEEDVAFHDIKEGTLTKYLLRPFSYFVSKFMEELPWRMIQGFFGILIFVIFLMTVKVSFPLVNTPLGIILSSIIILLALGVSYTFKMILGLMAMWTTDFWGILSMEEIIFLIFGGIVMPLTFYPAFLERISYFFPLAYIIYFPVIAIQGKLTSLQMFQIIIIQLIWMFVLYRIYQIIWRKGVKKFTGVGQ
jgi:ABC-2 type transport system permease protein